MYRRSTVQMDKEKNVYFLLLCFYIFIIRSKSACTVKTRVEKTRKYLISVATGISYCRERSKLNPSQHRGYVENIGRRRDGRETDYAENVVYIAVWVRSKFLSGVQKLFRRPFRCNFINQMSKKNIIPRGLTFYYNTYINK